MVMIVALVLAGLIALLIVLTLGRAASSGRSSRTMERGDSAADRARKIAARTAEDHRRRAAEWARNPANPVNPNSPLNPINRNRNR